MQTREAMIREIVDQSPPLTEEQLQRVSMIVGCIPIDRPD
jgi:hypothetical protein